MHCLLIQKKSGHKKRYMFHLVFSCCADSPSKFFVNPALFAYVHSYMPPIITGFLFLKGGHGVFN